MVAHIFDPIIWKQTDLWIQVQSGLYSEFQAIQGYIVSPVSKNVNILTDMQEYKNVYINGVIWCFDTYICSVLFKSS